MGAVGWLIEIHRVWKSICICIHTYDESSLSSGAFGARRVGRTWASRRAELGAPDEARPKAAHYSSLYNNLVKWGNCEKPLKLRRTANNDDGTPRGESRGATSAVSNLLLAGEKERKRKRADFATSCHLLCIPLCRTVPLKLRCLKL